MGVVGWEANRDEVTGEWGGKLHNEELNDLHCSPNTVWVKKNEMDGACSAYGG